MQQHDTYTPSDLIRCLQGYDRHPTLESRRLHTLEIIKSGGDIHSFTKFNNTCLHLAIKNCSFDVVQLLLEKGIDVNSQNNEGTTPLHLSCYYAFSKSSETELVPMLLYHGADPWIRNEDDVLPLDRILKYRFNRIFEHSDEEKWTMIATFEHLYYYMFDKYTESGISVYALLKAAYLDLPIFQEMVRTIKEVDLDNLATVLMEHILMMPLENLRLLLDKFDYVFKALFLARGRNANPYSWYEVSHENIYIILGSNLQREFIDWLNEWKPYKFYDCLFSYPASSHASREEIVYCLLSYGMEFDGRDIETVYKHCGYNDLFKLLRFLDWKPRCCSLQQVIPRLVFDVTGDIQKRIEDPQFWAESITRKSKLDFEPLLAYYAVPNLKDLCYEVEVEGKENFFKKLLDQPRIPLLVEMARNVFRRHFVQRLEITSAKQFYESLELLPISPHHRKIIALETELY